MSPRNEGTSTKERISECALELFKKHGYDNVTVVQICEKAGVTKRTFYYHYESKEQLVNGITEFLGVKAESFMESLVNQQTNVEILWTLLSYYSTHSVIYGANIVRQIYVNVVQGKTKEQFPYSMYLYKTVIRTIINAKNADEIKNEADAADIAFTLYHAFRSVTITWVGEDGSFDLEKEFRRVFEVILGVKNTDSSEQDKS